MLDLNSLVKKLIKKLSMNANTVCIIEKRNEAFVHLAITNELCDMLQVNSDMIENKSIPEILPLDLANNITKHYELAWKGQDVFYKLEFPHGNKSVLYKVLSPIIYKGEVVRLISHVVTIEYVPAVLRDIA